MPTAGAGGAGLLPAAVGLAANRALTAPCPDPTGPSIGTPTGGAGIHATASVVRIVGGPETLVKGGYGTLSETSGCASGAPGLGLHQGSHAFVQQDATILGSFSCANPSMTVPPILPEDPSLVTWWFDPLPTLDAAPWQTSLGATVTLFVAGAPGAPVALFGSIAPGPDVALPGIFGSIVLDLATAVPLGAYVLDAAGAATAAFAMPAVPALYGAVPAVQAFQGGAAPGFTNAVFLPVVN